MLDLLSKSEDSGLLKKAVDSNGHHCDLWLLMQHPAIVDRAQLVRREARSRLAVKEPYYGRDPSGRLFVRIDHPMDVEVVSDFQAATGTTDLGGKKVPHFLKAGNVALVKEDLPLTVE